MTVNRPDWGLRPQDTDRLYPEDPEGPETFQEAAQAFHDALVDLWEVTGLPVAQAAAVKLQAGVDTWRDWWKPMDWSGPLTAHWPETFVQRLSRLAGDSIRSIWAGFVPPFQAVLHAAMIEEAKAKARAAGLDIEEEVQDRIRAGEEPVQAWTNAVAYGQVSQALIFGEGTGKFQGLRPTFGILDEIEPLAELDPADFIVNRIAYPMPDMPEGMTLDQWIDAHRPRLDIAKMDQDVLRAFQDSTTGEWMTDDEDEDR